MLADVQAQLHSWWAPALAFAAGVVSFASPCVLPLVPGYVAFVTGQAPGTPGATGGRRIGPVLLFIAGFSSVFIVLFGFTASAASRWLHSTTGQRVAGSVVIAFGVFMLLYALRPKVPWLYREERPLLARVKPGPAWAFPLGMAFAAGWTPCIGPVLGATVTLASAQGTLSRAVLLLAFYSLGLGVPFFLIGLGLARVMTAARFFTRHYRWFAGVSGALMVAIGVLVVSGLWVQVLSPVLRLVNRFTPPI